MADVLLPGESDIPAGSEIAVNSEALGRAVAARPDLLDSVRRALAEAEGRSPEDILDSWFKERRATFDAVASLVAGAYYLTPGIAANLGYPGPGPYPIEEGLVGDGIADETLAHVIGRGPIYRPTP